MVVLMSVTFLGVLGILEVGGVCASCSFAPLICKLAARSAPGPKTEGGCDSELRM